MTALLHTVFTDAINEYRKELADANIECNTFEISVSASGRVQDGDVKITYECGPQYGNAVKGGTLEAVVEEYLRRNGWDRRHAPLALEAPKPRRPRVASIKTDNDDMPF